MAPSSCFQTLPSQAVVSTISLDIRLVRMHVSLFYADEKLTYLSLSILNRDLDD